MILQVLHAYHKATFIPDIACVLVEEMSPGVVDGKDDVAEVLVVVVVVIPLSITKTTLHK